MIPKIRNILSSEKTEIFSIAFLINSLILLIISLIVHKHIIKNDNIIICSYIEKQEPLIDSHIIIDEIFNFDDKKTLLSEETIIDNQADSSLEVNNIEAPEINNLETNDDLVANLNSDLEKNNISGMGSAIGKGVSNQSSSEGALDRLTVEIISSAEQRKTNVIWLLDSSISLSYQRKIISERFDKILQELNFAHTRFPIEHGIYSFGQSCVQITENLTNDAKLLKNAVNSIVIDNSGIENTFSAIGQVCKTQSKNRARLIIVVFTDEVGDDIQHFDSVSFLIRSKGTMLYVVGNPSPFGKNLTQFKFIDFDPNYDQSERWVEIQQGPESLHNIILDIKTLPIDKETLDSGFGPFALSKLCLDTGGLYFSVHPNRNSSKVEKHQISPLSSYISYFFDNNIMLKYKPDYRSIALQNKEAQSNIAKKALIQACSIPLIIDGKQMLQFKAFNESLFISELNDAQKFAAKIEPKINEIYNILLKGETAYETLDSRWKASYALAMGRILSTKCRIEGYNIILAEAKTGLKKKDKKSNTWTLVQSKDFNIKNSSIKKHYELSRKYLLFVIDNYPNTPWALIANEEISTPIGYAWHEEYQEPPKTNTDNGADNNNVPTDDKLKPKLILKPKRKIDKI